MTEAVCPSAPTQMTFVEPITALCRHAQRAGEAGRGGKKCQPKTDIICPFADSQD